MKVLNIAAVPVVAIVFASACSWAPYDGQVFERSTDPIDFQGCSVSPNSQISVLLQSHFGVPAAVGSFGGGGGGGGGGPTSLPSIPIAVSPSTPTATDAHGVDWYCWKTSVVLPASDWLSTGGVSNGETTADAVLSVLDNGKPVYVYKNDPLECQEPTGTDQLTNAAPCAIGTPVHPGWPAGTIVIHAKHHPVH